MNSNEITPQSNQYILWIAIAALVFLFFIWGLLSNDSGITGILSYEETIIAVTDNNQQYCSTDGGLNWGSCERIIRLYVKTTRFPHFQSIEIQDSKSAYQFDDKNNIIATHNAGRTWDIIYEQAVSEQIDKYYRAQTGNSAIAHWGAYYDPISGNSLFAVGLDGIVLIDTDQNIHEIGVGKYHPGFNFQGSLFATLLLPYVLVALSSTFAIFAAMILSLRYKIYIPVIIFQAAVIILSPISLYQKNNGLLTDFLILATLLNGEVFIFCIPQMVKIIKKYKVNWQAQFLKASLTGCIYILPYILWYFQIIPEYWWAFIASIALILFLFIKSMQDIAFWKDTHIQPE